MKKKRPVRPPKTAAPEDRELAIRPGMAALAYAVLSLVFFLPALLPGQLIFGTDFLAGGYFFYDFISDRLASGELPKWVPYVYGGLPLFSNPGSTFHPVHLLADLVLPTSKVLAVVFMVHIFAAGLGMYLLARELGCRAWIAFLAGIAFQFTGITLSWVYAGHDGRVMVTTLTPLFFFFLHMGVRTGRLPGFAGAAATLGLALLSFQIQNAYYLLVAGAIWGVFCLFHHGLHRTPKALARVGALAVGAVAFGFVMAAVNFLPFLGYVPESPRGDEEGRGYEYSVSFSMPPAELLSLAVPEQAGASVADPMTGDRLFPGYTGLNPMKLHTEYAGAFALLLLVLGAFYARRDRYWLFFLGLGVFFTTMALGGFTPLYRVYYEIFPGIKRFRAPGLAFYVVSFSLVVMAARAMELLARLRETPGDAGRARLERLPWVAVALPVLALLGALVAGGDAGAAGEPSRAAGWIRFLVFAGAVAGVTVAWSRLRLTSLVAMILLAGVMVADQWIIGKRFLHTVPPAAEIFAPDDVVGFLRAQPGPFRVWNLPGAPYRQHDNFLMLYGIEQAGGEHGNQLQRWNELAGAGEDVYVDWHNFYESPAFLDAANIRYLLSRVEIGGPGLVEVHRGSALVYENTGALPRAYLVSEAVGVPGGDAVAAMREPGWDPRTTAFVPEEAGITLPGGTLDGEARVVTHEPDHVVVRVEADREALLVLADNYHAAWEVEVDGIPAEMVRANHALRGVVVPAGASTVEFRFRPPQLYLGLAIYLGAFALLIVYGGWLLYARHRRRIGG
jgi:hypothetical protein